MIYIDPPYNTGKEFIYPDNYRDNLDTYMQYTGQKDDEGHKFGTNTDASGRYHRGGPHHLDNKSRIISVLLSP